VTLKDIARAVGLSPGGVSLAMRNSPEVTKETCERVQRVAREMGYRPNPMATSLAQWRRSSKTQPLQASMAWLNFWPDPKKLHSYAEFDCYWRGARQSAEKFGYRLEEFACHNMRASRLLEILEARGIHGIILPPYPGEFPNDFVQFQWDRFSTVRLARHGDHPVSHFVISAQAENAILAFDKMREKGYERIGYAGPWHRPRRFGAGFVWAEMHLFEELRLSPFLYHSAELSKAQKPFEAWLKEYQPDAILTETPELPRMLEKAGLRVGKDIGLAATNVLDSPVSAGIHPNGEEIGRVAVLVLISLINDNDRGTPPIRREVLIHGSWVDGASLPERSALTSPRSAKR